MIKKELILMLLYFLYSCQQKGDRQENKQIELTQKVVTKEEVVANDSIKIAEKDSIQLILEIIAVVEESARPKKAAEYGGGDVYGVKVYYYNQDSTLLKVVNESSSGDYGFSKEKFYLRNGRLLYTERITAEIDFGKEGDTSKYHIIFEKNFFPTTDKGLRLVQQKVANRPYDTLFTKEAVKKIPLTKQDYVKEMDLLKQIETYQLLDEN